MTNLNAPSTPSWKTAAVTSLVLLLTWQPHADAFTTSTSLLGNKQVSRLASSLTQEVAETRAVPSTNSRRTPPNRKFRLKYRISKTNQTQPSTFQPSVVFEVDPPVTDPKSDSRLVSAVGFRPATESDERSSWTLLRKGDVLSGTVHKILPYGVLVQTGYDIPSRQVGLALLHQTNLPDNMPLSSFQVGGKIENAVVSKINRAQGNVYLSLRKDRHEKQRGGKTAKENSVQVPRLTASDLFVGQQIENARVVNIVPYGAFVDIGHPSGRHALLHVTRMSLYKVGDITKHVNVGQRIKARIIHMDEKNDKQVGDIAVSILSEENDAFVDRRQLQMKRMELWRQVVRGSSSSLLQSDQGMEDETAKAKQELLQIDRQLWDLLSDYMDTPKTIEV